MKQERPVVFVKRLLLLLLGLIIAHLGVTLFLQSALGADPFNVLVQGIFRRIPWPDWAPITYGRTHIIICLLIILVLLVADRHYVRAGTLLCMALGGPIIDGYTLLLGEIVNENAPFPLRLLALALGCVILAFGMTIVIQSEGGTGPNDLVGVVISDKSGISFGIVRVVVDVVFAGCGFLLGGTLGIGTIVCAALVGPTAQLFMPIAQRLCRRFVPPLE